MNWEAFTPLASTLGGVLIGLSALWMLIAHGRIAGISGILGGLLNAPREDAGWRAAFLVGLLVAGGVGVWLSPSSFASDSEPSTLTLALAGLAVGFGTRLGSGCTSGHGVCGIGRLSTRSLTATGVFMATGALTVLLVRVLGGP